MNIDNEVKYMQPQLFGIYDGEGHFLRIANEDCRINDLVPGEYKAPLRISAGSGLSKSVFDSFRLTSYPSLNFIREHSSSNTIGAFVVNLQGVVSSSDGSLQNYQILVDSRNFSDSPQAYVLTPKCVNIFHENIHLKGCYNILPQKEVCVVCMGRGFRDAFDRCSSEKEKLGFLLHQIGDVLKNPNPNDPARSVD